MKLIVFQKKLGFNNTASKNKTRMIFFKILNDINTEISLK